MRSAQRYSIYRDSQSRAETWTGQRRHFGNADADAIRRMYGFPSYDRRRRSPGLSTPLQTPPSLLVAAIEWADCIVGDIMGVLPSYS